MAKPTSVPTKQSKTLVGKEKVLSMFEKSNDLYSIEIGYKRKKRGAAFGPTEEREMDLCSVYLPKKGER